MLSPDSKVYLIDHHHLVFALWKLSELYSYDNPGANNPYLQCYFTVTRDFSQTRLKQDEFFKRLNAINMAHPYDESGQQLPLTAIPRHIADLKDDPYRSLAGFVRKAGSFEKSDAPYTEFKWADYFRTKIAIDSVIFNIREAIAKSLELVKTDPVRKTLPGYNIDLKQKILEDAKLGLVDIKKLKKPT